VVEDIDGVSRELPRGNSKATVLFFVMNDCPISNNYAPEINRIISAYTDRGIAFYIVYPGARLSASELKKHARDFGFRNPLLADPSCSLAHRVGVTVTPEAVVLGSEDQVLYRGRIDDLYYDYGKRRSKPTHQELREALNAILTEQPILSREAKPVGCFIPEDK
jgi:hypothetical protein